MIKFVVPGEAPRPPTPSRAWLRSVHHEYVHAIDEAAKNAMGGQEPWAGPIALQIDVSYTVPTSWPKKRSKTHWKVTSPAAQNLVKLVLDGLIQVVFLQEEQVADLRVSKVYGPVAQTTISVRPLV